MSSYDSYEPRSKFGLYFLIAFLLAALLFYFFVFPRAASEKEGEQVFHESSKEVVIVKKVAEEVEETRESSELDVVDLTEDAVSSSSPEQELLDAGMGVTELQAEVLLKKIGQSLEAADLTQLSKLLGKNVLGEDQLSRLHSLAERGGYRLSSKNGIIELGELEVNRRSRWAITLEPKEGSVGVLKGKETRIYLDLLRGNAGEWAVEKVSVPSANAETGNLGGVAFADSLGVAVSFLEAVLEQDFDAAKSFVDATKVSDAKIAGLCIIFEEAKYQLREKKALRAMFNRDFTAGFIAHVQDESGLKAADFGMNLERKSAGQAWRVTEVNLDSLLSDYAQRVAGGDVHFTPLVQNPSGGDTLILYFGFDEDELTPRTERQLDIVAGLLMLDPSKKLTLSGHTDALGSNEYNDRLSGGRAGAVQRYLLQAGVPAEQIVALAEGEAKPRRPNSTADGEDNPSGRRANRRTEIYLNF